MIQYQDLPLNTTTYNKTPEAVKQMKKGFISPTVLEIQVQEKLALPVKSLVRSPWQHGGYHEDGGVFKSKSQD